MISYLKNLSARERLKHLGFSWFRYKSQQQLNIDLKKKNFELVKHTKTNNFNVAIYKTDNKTFGLIRIIKPKNSFYYYLTWRLE